MKVDESGPPGRLGVAVGHPEHDPFVQPEDIPEVRRKVLQERQFVRARIAEDRRQAVLAKKVVSGRVNGFHDAIPSIKVEAEPRARGHAALSWYASSSGH